MRAGVSAFLSVQLPLGKEGIMNWARRLRWQVAAPAVAALAALAAALPAAAQAAGPSRPGTGPSVPVVKAIPGRAAGAAAAPVLPLAGAAPAVATGDPSVFAYTGSNKHAYEVFLGLPPLEESLGGTLVGGPGLALVPEANCTGCRDYFAAYARGTNNALYQFTDATGGWQSLGGGLTSRPGVAVGALSVPGGEAIDVVVRGYDGSAYLNEFPVIEGGLVPGPGLGWMYLGGHGRVLAGSGPAVVNVGGTLYVLVLAADGSVWVRHSTNPSANWSDWKSLGGRASGDVGAASPAPGVGVVFVRGADGAVWYNEFAGTTAGVSPGWHSLGGSLTSGVGAGSAADGSTAVVVLGPNGRIYMRAGTWPALGNWTRFF
jgi:hypothetical protein